MSNVARGGAFMQDIASERAESLPHQATDAVEHRTRDVRLDPGARSRDGPRTVPDGDVSCQLMRHRASSRTWRINRSGVCT